MHHLPFPTVEYLTLEQLLKQNHKPTGNGRVERRARGQFGMQLDVWVKDGEKYRHHLTYYPSIYTEVVYDGIH
jgi:hypothetical protein